MFYNDTAEFDSYGQKLYKSTDFTVVYFTGFGVRRCEGASRCSGLENVEQLDAKGLLDLSLNPLNYFEVCIEFKPNLIFGTWVYWKSRCGWVCEVRPTKTHICDNYVPQCWFEFDDELSWLFTKRFRDFQIICRKQPNPSVPPILLNFMYLVALLISAMNSTHHYCT